MSWVGFGWSIIDFCFGVNGGDFRFDGFFFAVFCINDCRFFWFESLESQSSYWVFTEIRWHEHVFERCLVRFAVHNRGS